MEQIETEHAAQEQIDQNLPAPIGDDRALVLVVDDEPLIVDSLAAILSSVGLEVLKAYGGRAALETAMTSPPHLLLTDIAMPGMNGIQLAMIVAEALPACRILLFSGHASMLDLTPAHEAGFDFPLLPKPVHPSEMVRRIFASLRGCAKHRRRAPGDEEEQLQWCLPPVAI